MAKLSIARVQRRISKRQIAALAWALLSASCTAPSMPADRVGLTSEAVAVSGPAMLSAELDLDKTPGVERARYCPQAAFGTTSYLVTHSDATSGQIGATRIDSGGQVLQAFDIPGATVRKTNVTPTFRGNGCAPVVFAGGAFIALWVTPEGALNCMRVAEDGTSLGVASVATGLAVSNIESVTFDGSNVLASTTDGKVALVGTDCSSVTAPASLPATAGATRSSMGAAFDGTQYWIAYSERLSGAADRFLLQAVTTAGVPSGSPIPVAVAPWVGTANSSEYVPAVQGSIAVGGGKTVLAYSVYLNTAPVPPDLRTSKCYFAELSSGGLVSNIFEGGVSNPVLAFAGNGFAYFSNSPYSGIQKRLNDGTVIGSSYRLPAPVSSLVSDGTNLLVVSAGASLQNVDVSPAQLLGADLVPIGAPSVLQHMSERHSNAVVASGDQTSLVVWRGPDRSFWGSRVSGDSTVLDQTRFAIHPGDQLETTTDPAVASNGTDFLVGWGAATGAGAQQQAKLFNGSAGELIQGLYVAQVASELNPWQVVDFEPVIASNGSDYLMVWGHGDLTYEAPNSISSFVVKAARITSAGEVLDDPPLILQAFSNSDPNSPYSYLGEVGVAYDGTQYVVVSHVGAADTSNHDPPLLVGMPDAPINVQHVSAAGEVGNLIETPWRGSLGPNGNPPVITWGDEQGLVTFRNGNGLFAGRLSPTLAPLDAPAFLVTDQLVWGPDWRSSAAWDGSNYWVSWKDDRRPSLARDDLYVARVSPAGALLDPSAVVLSQGSPTVNLNGQVGTAGGMLASGTGHVLAAYTRFDPAPDVFNFTLHGRWLSSELAMGGEGGEAGANDGNGGVITGTGGLGSGGLGSGGLGNGEAGSLEEAGSPTDSGGASGGGTSASGASTTTNGGSTSANGGRSGGVSSFGGTAAGPAGGSSGSSHGAGCSMGGAPDSSNRSLFWLGLLALPLTRRLRRRATETSSPTP